MGCALVGSTWAACAGNNKPRGRLLFAVAALFLKSEVTRDFARRVVYDFAHRYDAEVEEDTYKALQDLVAQTDLELSDLKPVHRIDLQSFIFVGGC